MPQSFYHLDADLEKLTITQIALTNYRNFSKLKLDIKPGITAICGANGSGKTNILEAISLFAPGKGIRSTKLEEVENFNSSAYLLGWNISLKMLINDISYDFTCSKEANINIRKNHVNGNVIKQQSLTKYSNIINKSNIL